eukprot:CAMPEP_0119379826 /NCGR_PEP_ID=MMETSP1334-20130426/54246_1 /TAXON_ID=127549 /ORGANISM="Calcidiscus leptoporus, Strain RCC1130" /LENGTH=72 /DNA_ID=CAMNT_0007399449 /DNA_START=31 /DNA_END=249 /DNA_ORIENTATION=+
MDCDVAVEVKRNEHAPLFGALSETAPRLQVASLAPGGGGHVARADPEDARAMSSSNARLPSARQLAHVPVAL